MKEIRLQKPIMIYRVYEPVKIISNIEKINHQKKVIDRLSRKIQKLKQENKQLKINRIKAIKYSVERDDLLEEIKILKDRVAYLENQILINRKKNHNILEFIKGIEEFTEQHVATNNFEMGYLRGMQTVIVQLKEIINKGENNE